MSISIFELFSIGIGPSSSHTVGPMKASLAFLKQLNSSLSNVTRILVELYGSLALTGKGHGTDKAILSGLEGFDPVTVDPLQIRSRALTIATDKKLYLNQQHWINFNPATDLLFYQKELLPLHTNGMRFTAFSGTQCLLSEIYYSIGGGFIKKTDDFNQAVSIPIPYPFDSAAELLALCRQQQCTIADIMLANEQALNPHKSLYQEILHIAHIMEMCIKQGCQTTGLLPGGLNVKRRASDLCTKMQAQKVTEDNMSWLNIYAMAVNEENAAGHRIVTAPTNGAAGVIPAVLQYYKNFIPIADDKGVVTFLLTAGAIAILCKKNASISGAEVGCQGEVGSAAAMAAAGFAAVMGGTNEQIENAAEIAMEHHLGMTCDPIGGLVQIPCIERNAMGAVKAVNAARLSLMGDGEHKVSLDKVIETMRQTGKDMNMIYKETSLGGLAANVPEC